MFKTEANGNGIYSGEYFTMIRPDGIFIGSQYAISGNYLTLMTINFNGGTYFVRLNTNTKTLEVV